MNFLLNYSSFSSTFLIKKCLKNNHFPVHFFGKNIRGSFNIIVKKFQIKNAIRSPQPKKECIFCGNNSHSNYQCFIYPTVSKRRARLQELNKCECCLKPAHRRCGWKCQLCLQNHHRVICPLQENQPESQQETHHQPETQPSLSQVLKSDLDTNWRN